MSHAPSDYVMRPVLPAEWSRWRELLRVSPQATLFHSPEWYEALGAPAGLYGCYRGNELRGGLALGVPGPRTAGHPDQALTAYQGLLLPATADKPVTTLSTNKEITAAAASFLQQEFDAIHLRLPPEVIDLQPFIWQGFQAGVRYTYRLALPSLDAVLEGMDKRRRADLRAAEKDGVGVSSELPFDTVLSLAEKSFDRQGKTLGFRATAERANAALAVAGRCRSFVASDKDGRPLSAVWIVWDDRRAYYLIGGYDEQAGSANATALAMWKAIEYTASTLRLPEFDFEGSMLPSVERFFRKFGGQLVPTYTLFWQRPASLATRVRRKAARLVSGA
jgi:hypothetical protein